MADFIGYLLSIRAFIAVIESLNVSEDVVRKS